MKVRSPGTGKASATSVTTPKGAAELRAQGRWLLELAAKTPLVPPSLLGLSQGSLDQLAGSLQAGASQATQRRTGSDES